MSLVRDDPEFETLIRSAANDLGIADPTFVEKDYWVTQVLRSLNRSFPGGFLFTGGTSLSKGYSIIQRFSEDVDVLAVPPAGATKKQCEKHLLEMSERVASDLGMQWMELQTPSGGSRAHRGDTMGFDSVLPPGLVPEMRQNAVLLEIGYGDGHEPAEMVEITPLVCQTSRVNASDYDDTAPFTVRALHPVRTLVEKLFALHHVVSQHVAGHNVSEVRFGRHYYDVYQLLGHDATKQRLKSADFAVLVAEVQRVSAAHFGGTTPRPEAGFSESPAFKPDGDLRPWLEERYVASLELVPEGAERPSFKAVLARVDQGGAL